MEGRSYGPYPLRVCAEKVADFVAATGDDPGRWDNFAPPGWAAAALFVVAPRLLTDPDLGAAGASVIHGEQRFQWNRPIPIEGHLQVTGTVSRVRERGGVYFTTFEFEAVDHSGPLLTGVATFLMSGTSPPVSPTEPLDPPLPAAVGSNDPLPARSGGFPRLRRSASRADLLRYAGATRDWNPVHWDHASAVAAGFPTIVVHGLLQASWMLSALCMATEGSAPVAEAKFRFRSPMVAGSEATVSGDLQAKAASSELVIGDREIVSATMVLR